MFLAGKAAWAGIVFILLTTGISGPRPKLIASEPNLRNEVPVVEHPTDVNKIQETLRNKGHYRGKIDGVFGLRTRASIRGFQKAENLPVTGHLDAQTARKLGVTTEEREQARYETSKGKPSAGIKWAGRPSKPRRNAVKKIASPGDRADREKTLQAQNDNHAQ